MLDVDLSALDGFGEEMLKAILRPQHSVNIGAMVIRTGPITLTTRLGLVNSKACSKCCRASPGLPWSVVTALHDGARLRPVTGHDDLCSLGIHTGVTVNASRPPWSLSPFTRSHLHPSRLHCPLAWPPISPNKYTWLFRLFNGQKSLNAIRVVVGYRHLL